jgi:hypothetical protein
MPSFIGVPRDVLVIAVSPVLTTIGVFIAHRLNEKAKNPKLRIVQWGVHRSSKRSARVFAEVENKAGREVARDARATITIKKIANNREVDLDSADLVDMEQSREYGVLVSLDNPRVEGEPIPWMIPEVPYQSKSLHNLPLKHIANIGPGQRNRATVLEVMCIRESQGERSYYLVVFSEYGTEKEEVPSGVRPRIVRCVLKESYPPTTVEFVPLMSKVKALNPDIVFICSFPTDSVGIVKASKEIGLAPKIFGGFMVGLQLASIQTQLGPALNGLIVHHTYVPAPKMKFPGVEDVLARYQRQALEAGVDPLGWYNAPYAYAMMQVLEAGVRGCGCLDDAKIADWIKNHEIETVVGKIRFAPNGEWAKPRTLFIQFQNIRSADLSEFANPDKIVILWPEEYKSGEIIYPFPGWR